MITLKELVDRQKYSKETDNELIAEWFLQNDKAVDAEPCEFRKFI